MVGTVDENDSRRCFAKCLCRRKAGETASNDNNPRKTVGHSPTQPLRAVAVLICWPRSNKLILNLLFACEPEGMLRIERQSKGTSAKLKLSGRMQADGLSDLPAEIE